MSASPVSAPSRGVTATIAVAAVVAAAGVAVLLAATDQVESGDVLGVFGPLVGLSFVGTGLSAWRRRPESRYGVLMVANGFAWFLAGVSARAGGLHGRAARPGARAAPVRRDVTRPRPGARLTRRTQPGARGSATTR